MSSKLLAEEFLQQKSNRSAANAQKYSAPEQKKGAQQ